MTHDIMATLADIIASRKEADGSSSYVASLFAKGREKIAQKVGEEGVEIALALVKDDRKDITSEAADLIFHLLIALEDAHLSWNDVLQELQRREGISGIEEKLSRKNK